MRRRQTDIFKPTSSSLLSSSLNLHHLNNHLLKIPDNNNTPSSLEPSSSLFLLDAIRNITNIEPRIHHIANKDTTININRNNKTNVTPIQHQPSNENQNLLHNLPLHFHQLQGKNAINNNKIQKVKRRDYKYMLRNWFSGLLFLWLIRIYLIYLELTN